jgi:hypothetical protein
MDNEKLVHDIVRQVNDKNVGSDEQVYDEQVDEDQKIEDAMKSHPADSDRSMGTYNDVDTKLGDGIQEWPKYTDSIKQREL